MKIREEYDKVLASKLAEQYDCFVRFTTDQIQQRLSQAALPSCKSFAFCILFFCLYSISDCYMDCALAFLALKFAYVLIILFFLLQIFPKEEKCLMWTIVPWKVQRWKWHGC